MADTEAQKGSRTVPGAPPSANATSSKKKSKANKKKLASSQAQPITATTSALLSQTPSATEVDALLLGSLTEARTEQAQSQLDASLSPAAVYLGKRIKVLNKKLQRIATYDVKTLNVDQQRAISSKAALEMSVAELTEAREGIQTGEKEREEATEQHVHERLEAAQQEAQTQAAQPLALLFRFFALASYFDPSGPPSFAPRPLPVALESVGANTVHAVRQLHAALTLSGEDAVEERERRRETAHGELDKLSKSSEEVVSDSEVSYAQLHALIQALDSPPQTNGHDTTITHQDSPSTTSALPSLGDIQPDTFTAPSSPPSDPPAGASDLPAAAEPAEPQPTSEGEAIAFLPIRFMQEDEVQDSSKMDEYVATQQLQQHSTFQPFSQEPTPSFTPDQDNATPEHELAQEREEEEEEATLAVEVEEKQREEAAEPEVEATPETLAHVSEQKEVKFNWADDVEEQAELDEATSAAAAAATTAAPIATATTTAAISVPAPTQAQPSPQQLKQPVTEVQQEQAAARRAAQEAQRRAEALAAAKAARIDDDGFERVAPRKVKLPPQGQQGQKGRGGFARGGVQGGQRGGNGRGAFGRGGFGGAQQFVQQQQQQGQALPQQQQATNRGGRGGNVDGGASRGGFATTEIPRGRGGAAAGRGRGRGGAAANANGPVTSSAV